MKQEFQNLLTQRLNELRKKTPQLHSKLDFADKKILLAKILEEILKEQISSSGNTDAKTL